MWRSIRAALPLVLVTTVALSSGCIFSPDEDDSGPPPPVQDPIPLPTSPENLVEALEVIYNDQVRNAIERRQAYENLFPPENHALTFLFRLQQNDILEGLPESWGRDTEIAVHERMFEAQENRDIFSLSLTIDNLPAADPEIPIPSLPDAKIVFATNVNLRLLFNPEDGLEVVGGQAEFLTAPADDRWYMVEWKDLPRPTG